MPVVFLALYLKKEPDYPDLPPGLSSQVGWMLLAALALLAVLAWARAHSVRRGLLGLEDPRTLAILRIGFGLFTLICFLNLAPYWRMLWSDEGIYDFAYAQDQLGRSALRAWTPETGFFGIEDDAESFAEKFEQLKVWSILVFLWNKPSLLFLESSPTVVYGYMAVFFAALLLYTVGLFSRVTGVVSWFLMCGLYHRNGLFMEGTDTVYRCFWLLLLFAKTGHAWSLDNWLRCRRLRAAGCLQAEGAATNASRPGQEPVYRLVPAWPRYLFMLQLAAIYVTTGSVKTGAVWAKGDALYYALNMDHFYRFEYATQWVSSVLGMNLFRVNTWVTHWWERLFPLVLLGVGLRFNLEYRNTPWFREQTVWWRRILAWGALLGIYAVIYRVVYVATPYCTPLVNDAPQDTTGKLLLIQVFFAGLVPSFVVAWIVLGRWPLTLFRGGRDLGKLTARFRWARLPQLSITQDTLRWMVLGRRVWLSIGLIFHGTLIGFMNIGMFAPIMLLTYVGYVRGDEWVALGRRIAHAAQRRRGKPEQVPTWLWAAQSHASVPVRGRTVPDGFVLGLGLVGAWLVVQKVERVYWVEDAYHGWLAVGALVAYAFGRWPASTRAMAGGRTPALAYTAVGRTLVLFVVTWHVSAVAFNLSPNYPLFRKWRAPARSLYTGYLKGVGATQSWRMFSPNPPRANAFMKTVIVLDNGERWDLRNNAFHYESDERTPSRPFPWLINDRMRKMQRRMVGKGKRYLRYWAAFQCREWMLKTGEMPKKVVIKKYVTRIPKPEVTSFWVPEQFKGEKDHGSGATVGQPYNPRRLKVRELDVQTHICKADDLPVRMKERRGMPVTEQERLKQNRELKKRDNRHRNRRSSWKRRRNWGRWFAEDVRKANASRRRAKLPKPTPPPSPDLEAGVDDEGVPDEEEPKQRE